MPYHPSSELTTQQILFQLLILQKIPGTKIFTESFLNGDTEEREQAHTDEVHWRRMLPCCCSPSKGKPPWKPMLSHPWDVWDQWGGGSM